MMFTDPLSVLLLNHPSFRNRSPSATFFDIYNTMPHEIRNLIETQLDHHSGRDSRTTSEDTVTPFNYTPRWRGCESATLPQKGLDRVPVTPPKRARTGTVRLSRIMHVDNYVLCRTPNNACSASLFGRSQRGRCSQQRCTEATSPDDIATSTQSRRARHRLRQGCIQILSGPNSISSRQQSVPPSEASLSAQKLRMEL